MKNKWLLNLTWGLTAFTITFLFSIVHNTWIISLYRSAIGFILFFLLGYILRIVLVAQKANGNPKTEEEIIDLPQPTDEAPKDQEEEFEQLSIASLVKANDHQSSK